MTAGVAHEINNPLNYIMGACSGLEVILEENEMPKNPRVESVLNSLNMGVERISE